MLSDEEIAGMQETLEDSFPDTAQILEPSRTASGTGRSLTYNPVASDVPCRKAPMGAKRAQELLNAGVIKTLEAYIFTFKHDQSVASDYRITDGEGTYQVIGSKSYGSWTLSKRAECVKVG
jgi:hypothetical protein